MYKIEIMGGNQAAGIPGTVLNNRTNIRKNPLQEHMFHGTIWWRINTTWR